MWLTIYAAEEVNANTSINNAVTMILYTVVEVHFLVVWADTFTLRLSSTIHWRIHFTNKRLTEVTCATGS